MNQLRSVNSPRRFALVGAAVAALVAGSIVAAPPEPAAAATSATINFDQTIGDRNPNVFGAAINVLDDIPAIESIRDVGVNFIRRDAYLKDIVPDTTVSEYLAAMATNTGVANPATWNWETIGPVGGSDTVHGYEWVDYYNDRGFEIMLIMDYSVPWLGYIDHYQSPPSNMVVYRDIVKKIYERFEGKIDYVEMWNEPDHENFMFLEGSPYSTPLEAYLDIYENAAEAIRSTDAAVPLGGPSVAYPNNALAWSRALLQNPGTRDHVDFLTYHHYEKMPSGEGMISQLRNDPVIPDDMPVYLTEWNWHHAYDGNPMNTNGTDAIPYVAQRLDNLIRQNVTGAGYFAMNRLPRDAAFYSVNANGSLTPKMGVWRVMSKELGLGAGTFSLKKSSWVNGGATIIAGGATNSVGQNVAWIINAAPTGGDNLSVNMTGLRPATEYVANLYESNWGRDGSLRETLRFTTNDNGTGVLPFWIAYKSVVGIELTAIDQRPDLAQGKVASADSTFGAAYTAAAAVDADNEFTRWASAPTGGQHWLAVDLGSSRPLNQVEVNWETAYAVNYTVQTSTDNQNWTTVYTVSGNNAPGWRHHSFATVTARHVRVLSTQAAFGAHISAYSFGVFHDLAAGKTATGDSVFGAGYEASRAVDRNDTQTRWAAAPTSGNHWLSVDLATAQTVGTVRVKWETAHAVNYTVQTSTDGTTWTNRATVTGNGSAGWRQHSFTPVAAKYVRVLSTQAAFGAHISAYTLNAY